MDRREEWLQLVLAPLEKFFQRHPNEFRESRFRATTVLIDPKLEGQPFEQCAVNLFTADGRFICPLPLFILSFLFESSIGIQRQLLFENLETMAFNRKQIDRSLLEMVRKERRLIFSSVRDHHDGISSWRDNPDPLVHISNSGLSYLHDLSRSPAYLQWALPRSKEMLVALEDKGLTGSDSALDRFRQTRACFHFFISKERSISEASWDKLLFGGVRLREDQEARCQAPTLNLFTRSALSFLQDLAAHGRNLRRGNLLRDYHDVRAEAQAWVKLVESEISKHSSAFDTEDPQWTIELGYCRSYLRTSFIE